MQRFDFSLILFRTVNNYGYSGFHRNLLITISFDSDYLIEILNTSWLKGLLLVQARIENNIKIHEEIKDSALQIKTNKYTPTESHVPTFNKFYRLHQFKSRYKSKYLVGKSKLNDQSRI